MLSHLRRLYSDDVRVAELGPEFAELILDGLERTAAARLDGLIPPERAADVLFRDMMAEPLGAARSIYEQFGFPLTTGVEERMAAFLRDNPRERWGGHEYTFADTGLDLAAVRARTARYSAYFAVPEEV
jgi:hypothetical protein